MKTKRVILLIGLSAGIFCLNSCSGKSQNDMDTPEKVMQYTMEGLQSLDLKIFNKCTDNYVGTHWNWIGFPIEKEYRVFNELLQPGIRKGKRYEANHEFAEKTMEHLTWKIADVREDDGQAEIDLEITNLDMTDVMGTYAIYVLENMLESEGTGIRRLVSDLSELDYDKSRFISIIDELDENNTCTSDITVQAYEDDGKWKIHISDEFINAFMGNMMAENYSEDVEQQIEELENQYEQKMDAWGDEFADRIEKQVDQWFD